MISDDALTIIQNKYQTSALNVRREYIQHLFLSYFYQQPQTNKIFFKGGTALRLIYKSPRFSEDLDFGSTLYSVTDIEKAVVDTLLEIQKEGIETDIIDATKTTGGYLATIAFIIGSTIINLRIEISFREKHLQGQIELVQNDFIPAYSTNALSEKQLIDGKLHALLDRRKPRDFYDLYFLLQKDMISPKQKGVLREVLEIVKKTDINFKNELESFLPASYRTIMNNFKSLLLRTVQKFV